MGVVAARDPEGDPALFNDEAAAAARSHVLVDFGFICPNPPRVVPDDLITSTRRVDGVTMSASVGFEVTVDSSEGNWCCTVL